MNHSIMIASMKTLSNAFASHDSSNIALSIASTLILVLRSAALTTGLRSPSSSLSDSSSISAILDVLPRLLEIELLCSSKNWKTE